MYTVRVTVCENILVNGYFFFELCFFAVRKTVSLFFNSWAFSGLFLWIPHPLLLKFFVVSGEINGVKETSDTLTSDTQTFLFGILVLMAKRA